MRELRYIKISAIKQHALECSTKIRFGKFQRVGEDFVNEVCADVDTLMRSLQVKYPAKTHLDLVFEASDKPRFVTGEFLEKLQTVLDNAIARLIQRKVEQHPSLGTTLQGRDY